ncbi:hypothetical protein SAMN00768000_3614 [Sulfobacillus thermosulfidooxidans DSM 9293]|uniref:Uncharacterized protein n=1 Tax=Sulfobacillus thermosulfidooxidans (strain DSM 9293 / VKM B-1269 / AT-1) TaxID=929705 RepID=A0A1W1WPA2_SULTA|nr:hypothetical protein [Sulfobacillus thermosulfidooxidans]SMC08045.1 hypothetical protein SAMN00768000_3614 [Sulfobacillus thermosulfidooxidans DSM 9293]
MSHPRYGPYTAPHDAGYPCPLCGSPVMTRSRQASLYFPRLNEYRESCEREWYCVRSDCEYYDVDPVDFTGFLD